MSLNRRHFIQLLAALGVGSFSNLALWAAPRNQLRNRIPSSGERIPAIGLGSWLTFGIELDDDYAMSQRQKIMDKFI